MEGSDVVLAETPPFLLDPRLLLPRHQRRRHARVFVFGNQTSARCIRCRWLARRCRRTRFRLRTHFRLELLPQKLVCHWWSHDGAVRVLHQEEEHLRWLAFHLRD